MIPIGYKSNGYGVSPTTNATTGTIKPEPPAVKRLHELKLNYEFYQPLLSGEKKAEYRKDDRRFEVGDYLLLTTPTPSEFRCLAKVTHIVRHEDFHDIPEGFCILSIDRLIP